MTAVEIEGGEHLKENKPYFPILEGEISKRGILKKDIAERIGITSRALSIKLSGEVDLWWKEVITIQSLFPDVPLEKLFSHDVNV